MSDEAQTPEFARVFLIIKQYLRVQAAGGEERVATTKQRVYNFIQDFNITGKKKNVRGTTIML